jgi:ABC-type nitrate/sulfonate/bicarbonate transport system ATPase subunit
MEIIISIQDLELAYKDNQRKILSALGPLSLNIYSGEFLCVLGESGCGKTSLLRILSGLENPTKGSAKLFGSNIEKPTKQIGIVFQQPNLLPWLTVEDNLALSFKIRGEDVSINRIQEILGKVGVNEFGNLKPSELSGGTAQRVAIGRALINNPQIILMDEPFASLDALTRMKMQNELIRIWEIEKITTVFITHDIEEAILLADRIVILTPRPGRIAEIIEVSLPRPRSKINLDYINLKEHITELFFNTINSTQYET